MEVDPGSRNVSSNPLYTEKNNASGINPLYEERTESPAPRESVETRTNDVFKEKTQSTISIHESEIPVFTVNRSRSPLESVRVALRAVGDFFVRFAKSIENKFENLSTKFHATLVKNKSQTPERMAKAATLKGPAKAVAPAVESPKLSPDEIKVKDANIRLGQTVAFDVLHDKLLESRTSPSKRLQFDLLGDSKFGRLDGVPAALKNVQSAFQGEKPAASEGLQKILSDEFSPEEVRAFAKSLGAQSSAPLISKDVMEGLIKIDSFRTKVDDQQRINAMAQELSKLSTKDLSLLAQVADLYRGVVELNSNIKPGFPTEKEKLGFSNMLREFVFRLKDVESLVGTKITSPDKSRVFSKAGEINNVFAFLATNWDGISEQIPK